jgi:hypothetical protein
VQGFHAGSKVYEPVKDEPNYTEKLEIIKRALAVIDINAYSPDDFKTALETYKCVPIEGWLLADLKYSDIVTIINRLKKILWPQGV